MFFLLCRIFLFSFNYLLLFLHYNGLCHFLSYIKTFAFSCSLSESQSFALQKTEVSNYSYFDTICTYYFYLVLYSSKPNSSVADATKGARGFQM